MSTREFANGEKTVKFHGERSSNNVRLNFRSGSRQVSNNATLLPDIWSTLFRVYSQKKRVDISSCGLKINHNHGNQKKNIPPLLIKEFEKNQELMKGWVSRRLRRLKMAVSDIFFISHTGTRRWKAIGKRKRILAQIFSIGLENFFSRHRSYKGHFQLMD